MSLTLLSAYADALSFDDADLSYSVIPDTANVTVTGRAEGNESTEIVIPRTVTDNGSTYNVTAVGGYAFSDIALSSLTIGDSVTTIGDEAFSYSVLTTLTIPDSVTTIGSGAFYNNNPLTNVAFEGDFGTFELDMFERNLNLATITYCEGKPGWPQIFTINMEGSSLEATSKVCQFDFSGLSYSIVTGTENVIVTGRAEGNESTEIVIPGTVDHNGITYNVTAVGDLAFDYDTL
ncbi:MAG: leucine-rich repeat domain-containing protein, partial [Porticoccaceae bacterium]|nr:leucine-rich repeat domain-containing protein [Porticoccaceae bacterium]